jgi:hypothetical protein
VFAGIFGFVTIGAWVLSGAYWALSNGEFDKALKLQKVSWSNVPRTLLMFSRLVGRFYS